MIDVSPEQATQLRRAQSGKQGCQDEWTMPIRRRRNDGAELVLGRHLDLALALGSLPFGLGDRAHVIGRHQPASLGLAYECRQEASTRRTMSRDRPASSS